MTKDIHIFMAYSIDRCMFSVQREFRKLEELRVPLMGMDFRKGFLKEDLSKCIRSSQVGKRKVGFLRRSGKHISI